MRTNDENVNPERGNDKGERFESGEVFDTDEQAQYGNDPRITQSRLSLKIIGCRPELSKFTPVELDKMGVPHHNGTVRQCRIYGKLFDLTGPKVFKPGQPDSGATFGLVGINEAVNLMTGEFFKGGIIYLPEGFHDLAIVEIEEAIGRAGRGNFSIEYAWEFESVPASNPSGYSWRAHNLMPLRRDDPLASLRRRALAGSTVQTHLLSQGDPVSGIVIDSQSEVVS